MMGRPEYLNSLNPRQREAVEHEKDPLLILAGAGSGKTRVVTSRIAYLVEKMGFYPSSILAVTFTNKAAGEMKERVASLFPEAGGAMIRTFHSFGAWLLRRNAEYLGMNRNYSIYDDSDSVQLLQTLLPGRPRNEINRINNYISRAKDECLTSDDNLLHIASDPGLNDIYSKYEERLRQIGNADFGDLIALPVRLLQNNPEIKRRIHQRFRVILVDEYQDSNIAQFRLLQQLTGSETWLCVVGDDDQSIYRFRGAELDNILNFHNYFPGTRIIKLEENYRSTGNILAIASEVVANNEGRLGKTLWSRNSEGDPAKVVYLENQKEEAEYCARLIEDSTPGGTAILYRTNAQSRNFEEIFRRRKIPYRLVGTVSFYSREEVKDVLAYLSFISNPLDEIAFRRIINKPVRGIGKVSMEKILNQPAAFESYLSASKEAGSLLKGKAGKGVKEFSSHVSDMQEKLDSGEYKTLGDFVEQLIISSGLMDLYKEKDHNEHSSRVQNLEELISAGSEYLPGEEGLAEFLEHIALDQVVEEDELSGENSVTLITIHNTKGLEFDRVIITGMEDGLFPRGNDDDPDEIEEERRLFYVALTRARTQLYLTSCRYRTLFGRYEERFPSRFLEELPKERIREEGSLPRPQISVSGEWSKGDRLFHEDYGIGGVTRVLENKGNQVIHVIFENGRKAMFLPEFCRHKLERLGREEDW